MHDSESLNKRERAERGLEDLREMLVEMMTDGGKIHPGVDAGIDAAHALEGLDRAEVAIEKWKQRDINGEWRKEPESLTRDKLASRTRVLADDCKDVIGELESANEYSASNHVNAAQDALRYVVAHPDVMWEQSVARLEMVLEALERAREEVGDTDGGEIIKSLLSDVEELRDQLESVPDNKCAAASKDYECQKNK